MDSLDRLEIYIPVEAEVKSIPLLSLPASVLRKMGLPQSDPNGPKNLPGSPEGIWICPAVVRRKEQRVASCSGNGAVENMSSVLGREVKTTPGPHRMSFVSSNHAAYRLLKDMKDATPGKKVSVHRSHTPPLPQGSAPHAYQTAVVIYDGHVYLSVRKAGQVRRRKMQGPSTSQSKHQRKELLDDNRHETRRITCEEMPSEKQRGVAHSGADASSSTTARRVPQPSDSRCPEHARGEQAAEESAAPGPEQEPEPHRDSGECEMEDLAREAESTGCSSREPPGAAGASMALLKELDFQELAQEERIDQMKARLRRNEAALSNLHSS